jgi:hypothetical protein
VKPLLEMGAKLAEGFQLRYIKLLTDDCQLMCPDLPFTDIDKEGAGMLRGERITRAERHEKKEPAKAGSL